MVLTPTDQVPVHIQDEYRKLDTGTIIATVHVDDFLTIADTKEENNRFKTQMHKSWTISDLGRPKYIVGVLVSWDNNNCMVPLS